MEGASEKMDEGLLQEDPRQESTRQYKIGGIQMAIFKRGQVYWYNFWFHGEHVQASTGKTNPNEARQVEADRRAELADEHKEREKKAHKLGCGPEVLIRCVGCEKLFNQVAAVNTPHGQFCGQACRDKFEEEHRPRPILKDFAQRFIDNIETRCAGRTATIAFYAEKLAHLLKYEPLANAPLDQINEALIESYIQERSKARGRRDAALSPVTVNRDLATLRRLLRLAYAWQLIRRVPRVQLLPGEENRNREFVLSHADEERYLAAAPQPLHDIGMVIADAGLRTTEALNLEWRWVHLEPAPGAKYGYIHIPFGKSKNARRNVPITDRLAKMLLSRSLESKSIYVFPSDTRGPYRLSSIDHMHDKVRTTLQMPAEFVVYSLRHTYGTRLGEAGADAFSIMKLMGHCSVTVSQRYVHPTPEVLERAVKRLQAMNTQARKALAEKRKRQLPTTFSTTAKSDVSVSR
jgi:integrase